MVKYLYFVNILKWSFSWNHVDAERWWSVAPLQFQRETGNCHLFEISACKVVHAQQLRQSSLKSIVKVENKCTTIYLQWTLYSSHSCTYWCLCSFSVCPNVFAWRNCVWEQNKLIIHKEFPLALFLKLLTVLPSISLLAVFPHLFHDPCIRGVFGNQTQNISSDDTGSRSVSLHTVRHDKDANHWFWSQLDLLYGNASNTVNAATARVRVGTIIHLLPAQTSFSSFFPIVTCLCSFTSLLLASSKCI